MKIDIKWIIGILGTILMGLSTWVLVSVVDLKEKTSGIQAELFIINQQFGRVYNHMNEMMMKKMIIKAAKVALKASRKTRIKDPELLPLLKKKMEKS
jgi:uncharacterized phage-like protein YoqJ